jgi:hypothetical protein
MAVQAGETQSNGAEVIDHLAAADALARIVSRALHEASVL